MPKTEEVKKLYEYSPVTGEFLTESEATPKKDKPGEYFSRTNATDIAPPKVKEKEVAVFADGTWSVKPDLRGTTYYIRNDDGVIEAITIKDSDVTVPENGYLKADDVPKTEKEKLEIAEARRAALLAATDNEAMKAFKTGQSLSQDILDFDTAVRALKDRPDWPEIPEADWPVLPE